VTNTEVQNDAGALTMGYCDVDADGRVADREVGAEFTVRGSGFTVGRRESASDFCFTGRLGSQGAKIARVGRNHFHIELGQAPGHPEWCNLLQFQILRNARGNRLRLDVDFKPEGETSKNILFNHDASTWSYDGRAWSSWSGTELRTSWLRAATSGRTRT